MEILKARFRSESKLGEYSFENVTPNENYALTIGSRLYRFQSDPSGEPRFFRL